MNKLIAAALLALAAGCAQTSPPTDSDEHPAVAGTSWVSAGGGEHAPTIAFEDARAAGYAGCNRWFASYGATGEALEFGDVGLTRMMCPPAQMEIERAFVATLNDTMIARVEGEQLVLLDIGGSELARFNRAP
jgi:heat shock protein HslJ